MLKMVLVASCLLVTSMASQATIISHFGYERDSTSNIITGGGLEWLMWDVTKGLSINSALQAHADGDWTLATNNHMAALFNAFQFGKTDWDDREDASQSMNLPWSPSEISNHNSLMSLFGVTWTIPSCTPAALSCYLDSDNRRISTALHGDDADLDGEYKVAQVSDDATFAKLNDLGQYSYASHTADITRDHYLYNRDFQNPNIGVALVRKVTNLSTPVPLPDSISLLALGLVALGFRRRQASRR